MATIEVDRDLMTDLIYESAMYKLYKLEQLQMVRDVWNSIDVKPFVEVKPAKKPKNGLVEVERFK